VSTAPETLRQARRFDERAKQYRRALRCHRCAAQAAYGHQEGFANVDPPCAACRPIVATFPVPAGNGWRKIDGKGAGGPGLPVPVVFMLPDPATPRRARAAAWDVA
jgi:hypothetical protein